MRYAEGMKKAGKDVQVCFYEDGIHSFAHFNQTSIAEKMMVDVTAFLDSHRG
jgi:acetyl esterase/lipase